MTVLHCFKNVPKTLSMKHELLQSLLRSGASTRCELIIENESKCNLTRYNDAIQFAFFSTQLIQANTTECARAIFRGTIYRIGDIVILNQEAYQIDVEMGKITLILNYMEKLYPIVDILDNVFDPVLRCYELGDTIEYRCISVEDLLSYDPADVYIEDTVYYVKLRHGLVSTPLC